MTRCTRASSQTIPWWGSVHAPIPLAAHAPPAGRVHAPGRTASRVGGASGSSSPRISAARPGRGSGRGGFSGRARSGSGGTRPGGSSAGGASAGPKTSSSVTPVRSFSNCSFSIVSRRTQDLRDRVEALAVLVEDRARAVVGALDDAAHLVVDLARDLVGVVGLGRELAAEERLAVVVAVDARAELVAHAEAHHHLLGGRGHLLEVVGGAGRDLAEDDLLGGAAAERHRHRVEQLLAGRQEAVLGRHRDRVAERATARDHRDLVHRVGELEVVADDRVAHLVVGGDQPLALAHHARLLLGPGDHAQDALLELDLA